jgi:hypothetical protein
MTLPGANKSVVPKRCKVQKRKNHFVDFVLVVIHDPFLNRFNARVNAFQGQYIESNITPELTGRGKEHSIYAAAKDDESHSIRAPVSMSYRWHAFDGQLGANASTP